MSYATLQDMIDRFGEEILISLTDRSQPPVGMIAPEVVERALTDADSRINGYLSSLYPLPLADPPASLTRIACDLAFYFLSPKATVDMKTHYDESIAWLRDVSAGRVSLGCADSQNVPAPNGGVATKSVSRTFTSETLADYLL